MPLDSVRSLFSKIYDGHRETEMSLDAYLELCRADPIAYGSAAERLLRAIGQPEIIEPLYCDMDRIVGKAMQHVDASTAIFVLSNHGVLFSNLKITADNPGIEDLAPTALSLFGVEAPAGMEGRAFFAPA